MLSKLITDEICQKIDHPSPIFQLKMVQRGKNKILLLRLINVWQYWGKKRVVRKSEKIMRAKMKKMRGESSPNEKN